MFRGAAVAHFLSTIYDKGLNMSEMMLRDPVELSGADLEAVSAGQISLGNLINVNVSNLLNGSLNHDLNNVLNNSLNNVLALSRINVLSGDPITIAL
jgi:hypothetical protein